MKRLIIMFAVILLLTACSSNGDLFHEDFKKDIDQVIETLDLAHDDNRELNEAEQELLSAFHDKYIIGSFSSSDGKVYEMNDLEKNIVREIKFMSRFTEHNAVLSSDTNSYSILKEDFDEKLNSKKIPEDLKDIHPTYEKQVEPHPEFIKDTKQLISKLEKLLLDGVLEDSYKKELNAYKDKYGGDGFEIDEKHYLHSYETEDIYMVFWAIDYDLENGKISSYTQERFFELKEDLGIR